MATSARTINHEAGEHEISGDPVERAAAEAATKKSWREFAYYPKRYGERGFRFSLSDSGWIEALCKTTPAEATRQIRWLARLLAARGMPTYLMERHLDHLFAELVKVMPAESETYAVLERCAMTLREARLAQVPEASFREIARAFDAVVAGCPVRVANMGTVLVSAVADDAAGIDNALDSVEAWATDSSRFDAVWVAAVRETLSNARSCVQVAQSASIG